MLHFLTVANRPFPESWGKALNAEMTFTDEYREPGEWSRIIEKHYLNSDAMLTDFCPAWPELGNKNPYWLDGFNGVNALEGASTNDLPSFVYSPFTPPLLTNEAYRYKCRAVVNSYKYSIAELKKIIDSCLTDGTIWSDPDHDKDFANRLRCLTDEKLCQLTDGDITLYLYLVTKNKYRDVADAMGLKTNTTRNRASKIFQTCGFEHRTHALTYAMRIGITGIIDDEID